MKMIGCPKSQRAEQSFTRLPVHAEGENVVMLVSQRFGSGPEVREVRES